MKKEQKERLVNDALNHVDEKFIEEAASVHKSRNKMWIPALAAAAVLLIAAVIGIPALTKSTDKDPAAVTGHITGTEAPEGTAPADLSGEGDDVPAFRSAEIVPHVPGRGDGERGIPVFTEGRTVEELRPAPAARQRSISELRHHF